MGTHILYDFLCILGNKITFHGVDMINGTPILDIKPYIPQYDYPLQTYDSISLDRPPTEGTSDALELNNLQLNVPDVERFLLYISYTFVSLNCW